MIELDKSCPKAESSTRGFRSQPVLKARKNMEEHERTSKNMTNVVKAGVV